MNCIETLFRTLKLRNWKLSIFQLKVDGIATVENSMTFTQKVYLRITTWPRNSICGVKMKYLKARTWWNICTNAYALLTITERWRPPKCPSTEMNHKIRYSGILFSFKRNKVLTHATDGPWKHHSTCLKATQVKYYTIPLLWGI